MVEIPLVLTCDRKYLPYTTVCAVSAVRKTKRRILLYVLTDESVTAKERKAFLETFAPFDNVKAEIIDVSGIAPFRDSAFPQFPKIVYYRFLIPQLLEGKNVEKCIYLDSDMTVLADIGELFDTPLHGKLLGVCRDPVMAEQIGKQKKLPDGRTWLEYVQSIVKKPENYFVSACLVLNLKEIRARGQDLWEKAMHMDGTNFYCPDQDILNMVFEDEVTFLPTAWCCSPPETEGASVPEAKILHVKMWTASLHPSDDIWFRDLKFTPYYYRVRAEYLALLFERSVNNVLRPPRHGAVKSVLLFVWYFLAALAARFSGRQKR